jgi:hypothetical protein
MFDQLVALAGQLYPTGRAFKRTVGGYREGLDRAYSESEERALRDAISTFDSALPDNPNFTAEDASAWENRLGIINVTSVSLDDRKKGIIQKMNYPGEVRARGYYLFIQEQLRNAGFDVYVYENRFPDGFGGLVTKDPVSLGGSGTMNQHGDFQHGDRQHGSFFSNFVANKMNQAEDASFDVGYNLRSTFFIGGQKLGSDYNGEMASVQTSRKEQFRQLVLRLKPTQTVAFLFINYL